MKKWSTHQPSEPPTGSGSYFIFPEDIIYGQLETKLLTAEQVWSEIFTGYDQVVLN